MKTKTNKTNKQNNKPLLITAGIILAMSTTFVPSKASAGENIFSTMFKDTLGGVVELGNGIGRLAGVDSSAKAKVKPKTAKGIMQFFKPPVAKSIHCQKATYQSGASIIYHLMDFPKAQRLVWEHRYWSAVKVQRNGGLSVECAMGLHKKNDVASSKGY